MKDFIDYICYNVGLVGFSSEEKIQNEQIIEKILLNEFQKISDERGNNIALVSGLTNMGVPRIGYYLARNTFNWKTIGISAKEAYNYPRFEVDKEIIVGEKFGDESEFFINYIDILIAVGGGKQTEKEIMMAKNKNIKTIIF